MGAGRLSQERPNMSQEFDDGHLAEPTTAAECVHIFLCPRTHSSARSRAEDDRAARAADAVRISEVSASNDAGERDERKGRTAFGLTPMGIICQNKTRPFSCAMTLINQPCGSEVMTWANRRRRRGELISLVADFERSPGTENGASIRVGVLGRLPIGACAHGDQLG
jgi:hypothetical protein